MEFDKKVDFIKHRLHGNKKDTVDNIGNKPFELNSTQENQSLEQTEERIDAEIQIVLDENKILAKVYLTPPYNGGKTLSEQDIFEALQKKNIVNGIDVEMISTLSQTPIYEMYIDIAEGSLPKDGVDGKVSFLFHENQTILPEVENKELFKNLNLVKEVKKGETLCEIVPPTKGIEGFNVLGKMIPAKNGISAKSPNGENTYFSEDKTKLYASCDGYLYIKADKVSILESVTIKDDIIGESIAFHETVIIKGDVKGNASIQSGENIIVFGAAENVSLIANKNIFLLGGINGNKSKILCEGNITANFIENCAIDVQGNIYASAILDSDVNCNGEVLLLGEKACIIGGICRVGKRLRAKKIGNQSNILTNIRLMGPNTLLQKKFELEVQKENQQKTLEKLNTIVNALDNFSGMPEEQKKQTKLRALLSKQNAETEIKNLENKVKGLEKRVQSLTTGEIIVEKAIYNNVILDIDGEIFKNTIQRGNYVFYKKEDKIVYRKIMESDLK